MNELEKILNRYEIQYNRNDLIAVLTHNSFSDNNNSRYVFMGQFAFRGFVAEWIFENIAGTGTQLQHFLGNIFSQAKLENYFDKWKISKIRIATNLEINTQKHVFVNAFLGFIVDNATEKQLKKFSFDLFIVPNDHLLPQNHLHKNQWAQLQFLCKQQFEAKPKLELTLNEQKENSIKITLKAETIAESTSVSYKYAKKKSIAQALKYVLSHIEEKLKKDPKHIESEKIKEAQLVQKTETLKQAKQQKHQFRITAHANKMAIIRKQKEIEAKEKDKKRKETKQLVKDKKSRKGADTIYRDYTAEEIAAMSVSKRRNLQDKGIIAKGI